MQAAGSPVVPPDGATLPAQCPNCDAPVHGPYCAQCGQETVIGTLTLREFGHEYIQNFVSLEGRLWRTLWLLIRRPGMLTTEFLAGRRRRYVRPLPLYLSTSFVLFLLLAVLPHQNDFVRIDDSDVKTAKDGKAQAVKIAPGAIAQIHLDDDPSAVNISENAPAWLQPLVQRLNASLTRMHADPKQAQERMSGAVLPKMPYAAFFLVPFFAAVTGLLYRKRRRRYAEHFLFALHLHSFAFLSLSAVYLVGDRLAGLLMLVWVGYLTLALQRVYGGRRWPQLGRALLLLLAECLMLALEMALLSTAVFLFVV